MKGPLEVLREIRSGLLPEAVSRAGPIMLVEEPIEEVRDELAAVRIRSALVHGDIWLARDERVAAELAVEVAESGSEIPILTFAEVAHLRGKSDAMKRALLTTMAAMPGSRLVQ